MLLASDSFLITGHHLPAKWDSTYHCGFAHIDCELRHEYRSHAADRSPAAAPCERSDRAQSCQGIPRRTASARGSRCASIGQGSCMLTPSTSCTGLSLVNIGFEGADPEPLHTSTSCRAFSFLHLDASRKQACPDLRSPGTGGLTVTRVEHLTLGQRAYSG